jgi:hypothetical protein
MENLDFMLDYLHYRCLIPVPSTPAAPVIYSILTCDPEKQIICLVCHTGSEKVN